MPLWAGAAAPQLVDGSSLKSWTWRWRGVERSVLLSDPVVVRFSTSRSSFNG